jgi:hypothetical protein
MSEILKYFHKNNAINLVYRKILRAKIPVLM